MEGLILIVAELAIALVAPVFALIGGFLAVVLDLLVVMLELVFTGRRRARAPAASNARAPARRVARRWLHAAAATGAVVLAALLVVQLVLFDPALRWTLDKIAARSGYRVSYDSADGNLFSGRLALERARVVRAEPEGPAIDLALEHLAVDLRVASLLTGSIALDSLTVTGVSGRIARPARPEGASAAAAEPRVRRSFSVERAELADIDVEVAPGGRPPLRVEIVRASAAPFRSRSALFDLFFRSTLQARIDGVALDVATEALSERARRTRWSFRQVPVATLAALTGRAPVSWLSGGDVSAEVHDEWDLSDTTIDMDWRLRFTDVRAAAPRDAALAERVLATGLSKALARSGGNAEFAVSLRLDRGRLEVAGSDDLSALWEALRDGFAAELARRTGETADAAGERIDTTRDRLRDWLQRDDAGE